MEISRKLQQFARQYSDVLQETLGDSLFAVVLFGSVARGEAGAQSDADLLIVVAGLPPGQLARQEHLEEATRQMEPERERLRKEEGIWMDVSPVLKTPEEANQITPLYLDMVEDAIILFERDAFFSTVLERLRASLARLGAKRLRRGQVRYWDLKPDYVPGEIFEL